jgi:type IV pilus assembly protein PilB
MASQLGQLLLRKGFLTDEQLEESLRIQCEQGGHLGTILVQLGYLQREDLTSTLGEQHGLPSVELAHFKIERNCLNLVPVEAAVQHQIVPLMRTGSTLVIAVSDPSNLLALDEIRFRTGCRIEPVIASAASIRLALEDYYGAERTIALQRVFAELRRDDAEYEVALSEKADVDIERLQDNSLEAPIIRLVNIILGEAIRRSASDIHLEPFEGDFRIRFRIDGVLHTLMTPPVHLRESIISRLKILANLDISERRLPQDGRMRVKLKQAGLRREIDIRVSSLPTLFGEKVVLRILDPTHLPLELERLGFEEDSMLKFRKAISRPSGMVLVTGPTGSGKTSTLYTVLRELNREAVNILTVEDPVEINLPGINQVQVIDRIGRTFAGVLRAFLRQDPDIIMVGEIRDSETAGIAVKAALTGHLVLSTLHTTDAPSSVSRLLNMGIEPYLVAGSIRLICAQRLVRVICPECGVAASDSQPVTLRDEDSHGLTPGKSRHLKGAGCQYCSQTGFRGRTGIFEVLDISPRIQELISSRANVAAIRKAAADDGMRTLRASGLAKVRAGLTTLDEVVRATSSV